MANYPERKEMIEKLVELGYAASTKYSTAQLEKKWDKHIAGDVSQIAVDLSASNVEKPTCPKATKHQNKARRRRLRNLKKRRGW